MVKFDNIDYHIPLSFNNLSNTFIPYWIKDNNNEGIILLNKEKKIVLLILEY